MEVISDVLQSPGAPSGSVVTIGNYDGLHVGQRAILDQVVARAEELELQSVLLTFEPHPVRVLRPDVAPPLLLTPGQKRRLLEETGLDFMAILQFTNDVAGMSPREFGEMLVQRLGAREVHVGHDFSFGKDRRGTVDGLRELGGELGFDVVIVEAVEVDGERVSSTLIRELIADGRMLQVRELLGRPYAITGVVGRGDRMGQRLGWPTINVVSENELIPSEGVYTCRVSFPSFPAPLDAVTNIGTRPTIYENYERVVESHILDFRSDVYGEAVELEFYKRLRDEKIFQSTMDLSAQIGRDVEQARDFFRALG